MMFTGIIREVGVVRHLRRSPSGALLEIRAPRSASQLVAGGSVAVDGACLTVTSLAADSLTGDVVPETLARTTLGELRTGERVNLELPLTLTQPLDGHLVQGHVDGVGTVRSIDTRGGRWTTTIELPDELRSFVAEKGSIAINGVSLTVAAVAGPAFSVALIPTTLNETNLKDLKMGSRVNLEVDLVARYIAKLLAEGFAPGENAQRGAGGLTLSRLEELGF
jgi:riboflavin synthase